VPTPTQPRQVPRTPEPAERTGASAEAAVALWRAVRTAVRAHVSRDQFGPRPPVGRRPRRPRFRRPGVDGGRTRPPHRGVTRNVATELVRDYPEDRIESQIEHVDRTRRKIKDRAAYLVSAIQGNFATKAIAPPTKAEPQAAKAEAPDEQARQARAQDRAERLTMRTFWEGLAPAEREAFDAEALAHADPELRAAYDRQDDPRLRRLQMLPIRDAHLRARLTAG
jgi:hypothetical protein